MTVRLDCQCINPDYDQNTYEEQKCRICKGVVRMPIW
jgi:hypothetical protein